MNVKPTRKWLAEETPGSFHLRPERLARAREFVFERWKERANERGREMPSDLSSSCKFSSLFMKLIFGGRIDGNYDHQFNVIEGEIVDLCQGAADVAGLKDPYRHDASFMGSPDHVESLTTCLPRVETWVETFSAELRAEPGGDFPHPR